jgi:subfamily B ATP-binding cassette protein MsbA
MADNEKKKLPLPELLRATQGPYRMLFRYLLPYRRRFIIGILCGFGYALVNGLFPLVVLFVGRQVFGGGGDAFRVPGTVARLLDWVDDKLPFASSAGDAALSQPGIAGVLVACVLVPLVMIIRSLLSYGNSYCMAWVSFRMLRDVRRALFAHLLHQSLDFFNKAKSGKLISRVTNDVRVAQTSFISVASDIFKDPFSILVGVSVLLALDWKFCLVTLILFPTCLVPVIIFGRKVRKAGRAEEDEAGAMAVILQESFAGIRIIKSFGREDYQADQFTRSSEQQMRNSMRVKKSMDVVQPLIEVVSAAGVALALLYVFFFNIPPEKLLALMAGIFLLYEPAKKVSRLHMLMQKALAASTNVFALLQQKPTIQDAPDATVLETCRGEVQFEHVTFSYGTEAGDPAALRDVHLTIEPGRQVALVGSSGAGKSTMLSLMQRFYDPQAGVVRLDGRDIRSITQESLRRHIGVVSQETFLFHDTIEENIRFGRLDATREEVEQAARLAYAHDFILAQPEGYETIVGDKGCLLSGGQQQRLSIARAILKDAPILLLDEATSALDSESERIIQSALERLTQGRTTIAIAHRLSTVLKSDTIVVMDGGRIVDAGSHAELLERSAIYRRIYELQFHQTDESHEPTVADVD